MVSKPAISANAIEKAIGAPQGTINRGLKGSHIPKQHIFPLFCELSKYGFKYEGFDLAYDDSDCILYASKIGDNKRTIEIKTYPDGSTKEIDVTEMDGLDEDHDGCLSSEFIYLHEVYKVIYTGYEDL